MATIANGIKYLKSNQNSDLQTELSEDFSLFTKGSESEPDATDICVDGELPSQFTKIPGWQGFYVHQAGGAAFVGSGKTGLGVLATPALDLSDNGNSFYVRFKVKSKDKQGSVLLSSFGNDGKVISNISQKISTEWSEYTVVLKGNESTSVEFFSNDVEFFIDDIKITDDRNAANLPENIKISDYNGTSAIVSWDAVEGDVKYQVYQFCKDFYTGKIKLEKSYPVTEATNQKLDDLDPLNNYTVSILVIYNNGEYMWEASGNSVILDLPYVEQFYATDVTPTSFTVNWTPVEGADAYQVLVFHQDEIYNQSAGVKAENGVTGTSCRISGLDLLEYSYFFTVVPMKNGGKGSYWLNNTPVPKLEAPAVKPATNVTENGFTANWDAAESEFPLTYGVNLYKEYTAKTTEQYSYLDTDFSDITTGTTENPDKGHQNYSFADGYWTVDYAAFANGMVGLESNNSSTYNAQLSSSLFDLSQGDGTVSVDVKYKGSADATEASVYITNTNTVNIYSLPVTTELKESHIELTGATKDSRLVISTYSGIVYIDEIRVYTTLSSGQKIAIPFAYKEADATNCDFKDITLPSDYKLYYNVYSAFRPKDQMRAFRSEVSEKAYVDMQGAVAEIEKGSGAYAYVADGVVRVVNPDGEKVDVYSVSGALVATSVGENPISLPDGMYIVRIGAKTSKIIIGK